MTPWDSIGIKPTKTKPTQKEVKNKIDNQPLKALSCKPPYPQSKRLWDDCVFTSHFRTYFRPQIFKDPWREVMGFEVVHFSVTIWMLLLGECMLLFSAIALQRSSREIDALSCGCIGDA
jgi:hypothetical protein